MKAFILENEEELIAVIKLTDLKNQKTKTKDTLDEALKEARETVAALKRVDNDRDFYLLTKAIAKDSISIRWKREAILETVEDVLLSRA